jgi:hypothetical protein
MKNQYLFLMFLLLFSSCKKDLSKSESPTPDADSSAEKVIRSLKGKMLVSSDTISVYGATKKYVGIYFLENYKSSLIGVTYYDKPKDLSIDVLTSANDMADLSYKTKFDDNLSEQERQTFKTQDVIIFQVLKTLPPSRRVKELADNQFFNDNSKVPILLLKYRHEQNYFEATDQYNRVIKKYQLNIRQ